jgi:hypothetical protein
MADHVHPPEPDGPGPSGRVGGVLTLIRSGGRRPFELAEAGAMDRMSRHIGLAQQAWLTV